MDRLFFLLLVALLLYPFTWPGWGFKQIPNVWHVRSIVYYLQAVHILLFIDWKYHVFSGQNNNCSAKAESELGHLPRYTELKLLSWDPPHHHHISLLLFCQKSYKIQQSFWLIISTWNKSIQKKPNCHCEQPITLKNKKKNFF